MHAKGTGNGGDVQESSHETSSLMTSFLQKVHMYKIAENLQIISQKHSCHVLKRAEQPQRKQEDFFVLFSNIKKYSSE